MDHEEALDVLGLRGPADAGEVKQAYRRLARELHPDAGGDADAFHRVRQAFELLGDGTPVRIGPAPQEHTAGVEERWWDAPGAWHDKPVDRRGVALDHSAPDATVTRADLDLVASLLHAPSSEAPVHPLRLVSRAPGSWLHGIIAWLQPDLLAGCTIAPATDGPRPGHDVVATLHSAAGRGRRTLAEATPPDGWTRSRGSESVRLHRRLRPCHDPADTAVRLARVVAAALDDIGWPLQDWFLLRD